MLDAARDLDAATALEPHRPTGRACPELPWLVEARRMMLAGPEDLDGRRQLLHRLGRINRRAPWTVPWCGLFVEHCLRVGVPGIETPFLPARARPWKRWGHEVAPQIGALMCFWHYHPALLLGHVAFYWAEDTDAYHVLGGNQGHRVCIQRYPRERFVTARWPEGVPRSGLRRLAPAGAARPFA